MMRRFAQSLAALVLMSGTVAGQSTTSSPSYPGSGHTYQVEYGRVAFKNAYSADGVQMTYTRLTDGRSAVINYTALEVRPNLFWNTWTEADGTSVARVEDFENGKIYTIVHFPDGKIVNLSGTFRKLD